MRQAVEALVDLVEQGPASGRSGLVVTLNPEMVMRAQRDRVFRDALEHAAMLVPDGVGIVRALRRRGHPDAARVTGADLIVAYLPRAAERGHRIALAGGGPGVAAAAGQKLQALAPGLQVVAVDGGIPDAVMASRLREARPQLVLAAFGAGLQELFLMRYLAAVGANGGIGVGGAFDYFSGRVRRAPAAVQRAGLEWAWRLMHQPRRLRRQAVLPRYWWMERREAGATPRRQTRGR